VVPQAMRVIIPPLTSQYLNLTKNSSLAVAIGYPDLVQVFTGTVLNQTGQAVEVVAITMLVYLVISLTTSLLMNIYKRRGAVTAGGGLLYDQGRGRSSRRRASVRTARHDLAAGAADENDRGAGMAARQSAIDAIQHCAHDPDRSAACLGYSRAGQISFPRCGVERRRSRRLPRIGSASRDRRLLAVRLGAAAILHLRLLSDFRALAGRRILRDARAGGSLAGVAPRAAARSPRRLFLCGAGNFIIHSAYRVVGNRPSSGRYGAVGRRAGDDRSCSRRHRGLAATGNTSRAWPTIPHAGRAIALGHIHRIRARRAAGDG